MSQQPAPNFSKSVKLQLSLRDCPVPTKTRTFVPGATQDKDPRAAFVTPRPSSCRPGSPGCGAASGRPPSHASRRATDLRRGPWPGPRAPAGASPAVPPTGPGGSERRRLQVEQLGTSGRAALVPWENLRRGHGLGVGTAPRTEPLESALRRTRPPRRLDHVEPVERGAPGASGGWLPGRAEVRQGSGRRGDAAGPGAREGLTAVTETPRWKGPEARVRGRGGSQGRLPPALDRQLSSRRRRRRRLRPRVLRCHEPEGGEKSRESRGSGARRQRRPGHVPPAQPISPGRRGDVRAAAWPLTATPVTWPGALQWAVLGLPKVPGDPCVGGGWVVRWRL